MGSNGNKYFSQVIIKVLSHKAMFSCNLQCNGVSSCLLQEKLPPVTLLVCKIIRLQVIQQLAYVYNSTGAWNIFFTQICVASCKKQLPRVTWPLVTILVILTQIMYMYDFSTQIELPYFKFSFPPRTAALWNNSPRDFKLISSLKRLFTLLYFDKIPMYSTRLPYVIYLCHFCDVFHVPFLIRGGTPIERLVLFNFCHVVFWNQLKLN